MVSLKIEKLWEYQHLDTFLLFVPFILPGHSGPEILSQVSTVGLLSSVNTPSKHHTDIPQACLSNTLQDFTTNEVDNEH